MWVSCALARHVPGAIGKIWVATGIRDIGTPILPVHPGPGGQFQSTKP